MYEQLGIAPDAELGQTQGMTVRATPTAKEGYKVGGLLKEIM
jgi:hypothetical protein